MTQPRDTSAFAAGGCRPDFLNKPFLSTLYRALTERSNVNYKYRSADPADSPRV